MKRLGVVIAILLALSASIFADETCDQALAEGKTLYNSGKYKQAKEMFDFVVSECGDSYGDAATWSMKCKDKNEPTLTVSTKSIGIGAGNGSTFITVTSNRSWKVENNSSTFFTLSKNGNKVTINYSENVSITSRSGYFDVVTTDGTRSVRVKINQEGKEEKKVTNTSTSSKPHYTYNRYFMTDSTYYYLEGDTTISAEAGAIGSETLQDYINKEKRAKTGAISSKGKGVIVYGTNGLFRDQIPEEFRDTLLAINKRGKVIQDVAMSNDMKYYCVVYDKNKFFTNGPQSFKNKLSEFRDNNEELQCVSINDKGESVVMTDKHYWCSSQEKFDFIKDAGKKYGYIYSACLSNNGIVVCAEKGIYFKNVPPKVYERMVNVLKNKKFKIKVVKFTDAGTCLITDGEKQYAYWL